MRPLTYKEIDTKIKDAGYLYSHRASKCINGKWVTCWLIYKDSNYYSQTANLINTGGGSFNLKLPSKMEMRFDSLEDLLAALPLLLEE